MIDWYRIFRPQHWLRIYPYSAEWDVLILTGIINNEIEIKDCFKAKMAGFEIWISMDNYPFAFGTSHNSWANEVMPSAKTVDLLHDYVVAKS
ncbi:MAG: hypothetical protein KAT58_02740 [candidate division Zixibacteria bacterium]|nr:hypothetical protein [candidate division Zixibacteria bacterium]